MKKDYYAIKSKSGEYLAFYFNGRYETTDIEESELNVITAYDILFEKYEHAEYELESIKNDASYTLSNDIEIDGIVKLSVKFDFEEELK